MAVFNAASVLEALDYDFTDLAGPPNNIAGLAEAKGTIPEPTERQVRQFLQSSAREMQRIQRQARKAVADAEAKNGEGEPAEAAADDAGLAVLADVDMRAADATRRRDAEILAKLCSGQPSAEILMLLPHRIYKAFSEWLLKEVLDPEAVTGAGKPPLAIVRSPAAG